MLMGLRTGSSSELLLSEGRPHLYLQHVYLAYVKFISCWRSLQQEVALCLTSRYLRDVVERP